MFRPYRYVGIRPIVLMFVFVHVRFTNPQVRLITKLGDGLLYLVFLQSCVSGSCNRVSLGLSFCVCRECSFLCRGFSCVYCQQCVPGTGAVVDLLSRESVGGGPPG